MRTLPRRELLQLIGASAVGMGLQRGAFAQTTASTTKLTDNITLITGAGNNIVSLAGGNGSLLVDCGDAAHAAGVLQLTGKVATAFNTHWHLESTGGNDALAKSGAKLISHISTQLWMTQEITHDWEKKTYPPRAKEAQPTETFSTTGKLTFGDEPIEYGLMPLAHTDGDIYVHFMKSDVLAVGDAIQPGRFPVLDWFCGGWIGGMQEAHRTVLKRANDTTKIVPATGPVMTKAEVQASLDLLTKVREALVKLMKSGKGAKDWIDAKAAKEFEGQLTGNQDEFLYLAYRGLWAHARELGGIV